RDLIVTGVQTCALPIYFEFPVERTMAGSVNKVILVGNLGKDPEVRRMQDGRPVVNMSVATSESWRDKATGERKERTEWHRVVIRSEERRVGKECGLWSW